MSKTLRFLQITVEYQHCQGYGLLTLSIFYLISNHKNFIPKYLDNALTDFA